MRERQTEWGVERGRKGGDEGETDGVGGGEGEERRR